MLAVYVEDNGVGIPPEIAGELFQPLVRGKNGAQKTQNSGRGLGLALCQTIIAAHGGTIGIASSNQRGTSIRFTLPLAQPDTPET